MGLMVQRRGGRPAFGVFLNIVECVDVEKNFFSWLENFWVGNFL